MLPENNISKGGGTYTASFLTGVDSSASNPPRSAQSFPQSASSAAPASLLPPTPSNTHASPVQPAGPVPPDTRPITLRHLPSTTPATTGATVPTIPVSRAIGMSSAPSNALFNLPTGAPPNDSSPDLTNAHHPQLLFNQVGHNQSFNLTNFLIERLDELRTLTAANTDMLSKMQRTYVTKEELASAKSELQMAPVQPSSRKRRYSGPMSKTLSKLGEHPGCSHLITEPLYSELLLRKLHQMTVFLWCENASSAPQWIDLDVASKLRGWYHQIGAGTKGISGLSLLLFASLKNDTEKVAYDLPLGKASVGMIVQVIMSLWAFDRKQRYRSWDSTKSVFQDAKNGEGGGSPPLWYRKEFAQKYEESEIIHAAKVIDTLSRYPSSTHGYPGLGERRSATKKRKTTPGSASITTGTGSRQTTTPRTRKKKNKKKGLAETLKDSKMVVLECDVLPMQIRCGMLKWGNSHSRSLLRTARAQCKKYVYKEFYFGVKKIAAFLANGDDPRAKGYWFVWLGPKELNGEPTDLQHSGNFNIPEARTETKKGDTEEAAVFNARKLKEISANFPCMKAVLHFRKTVRAPTESAELKKLYDTEIAKVGSDNMYVPCTVEVDFLAHALKLWESLLPGVDSETAVARILLLSKHSLRSIFILAMGLRGATRDATTKGPRTCTRNEEAAWMAVSASDKMAANEFGRAALMMGAILCSEDGTEAANKGEETRRDIERRVTTTTYTEYLEYKRAKEEEARMAEEKLAAEKLAAEKLATAQSQATAPEVVPAKPRGQILDGDEDAPRPQQGNNTPTTSDPYSTPTLNATGNTMGNKTPVGLTIPPSLGNLPAGSSSQSPVSRSSLSPIESLPPGDNSSDDDEMLGG